MTHAPKKILLFGTGISTSSAAKLLASMGQTFFFTDDKIIADKKTYFQKLGGHYLEISALSTSGLTHAIVSPGIPPSHPLIKDLKTKGVRIQTEMDLAQPFLTNIPIVPITGSNGKSTVCLMISHILNTAGFKCQFAGNIGKPLSEIAANCDSLDEIRAISLELSSYQIEYMSAIKAPCAILTNISPDHLERHGNFETYLSIKWRILSYLSSNGTLITDSPTLRAAKKIGLSVSNNIEVVTVDDGPQCESNSQNKSYYFEGKTLISKGISIELEMPRASGTHNLKNAAMAMLAASIISSKELKQLAPSLATYKPLAFRTEFLGFWKRFPLINDSKSTNVASTLAALSCLEQEAILMLGGQPKAGDDFKLLLTQKEKIRCIIAFGPCSDLIADSLKETFRVIQYQTLKEALSHLATIFIEEPAAILFSPGCASFDEFENFEARGRSFNKAIQDHAFYAKH